MPKHAASVPLASKGQRIFVALRQDLGPLSRIFWKALEKYKKQKKDTRMDAISSEFHFPENVQVRFRLCRHERVEIQATSFVGSGPPFSPSFLFFLFLLWFLEPLQGSVSMVFMRSAAEAGPL